MEANRQKDQSLRAIQNRPTKEKNHPARAIRPLNLLKVQVGLRSALLRHVTDQVLRDPAQQSARPHRVPKGILQEHVPDRLQVEVAATAQKKDKE